MGEARLRTPYGTTAAQWNEGLDFIRAIAIGAIVDYWPLGGDGSRRQDDQPIRTRTRSAAWELASGDPVVMLEGRVGGHALRALDVITVDPDVAALSGFQSGALKALPALRDAWFAGDEDNKARVARAIAALREAFADDAGELTTFDRALGGQQPAETLARLRADVLQAEKGDPDVLAG